MQSTRRPSIRRGAGRWLASLALSLCAGCSTSPGGAEDTGPDCTLGTEGCNCFNESCLEPWSCAVASNICVDLGGETGASSQETSSSSSSSETEAEAEASTGDGDGDASTGDGDATTGDGDATTGDGDGDASTSTGDGDGDTTSGDGDGDALLGELERCNADNDCETGLVCRETTKSQQRRCVSACVSNAQCPANYRCQDDGSGSTYCLGSDIGRSCTTAAGCNFACLLGQNYCTDECQSGSDCPNGWGCMPVGTPAQNVCVKNEALCDSGDASACITPSACDTGANMILSGCTSTCNTAADCPQRAAGLAAWTCDGLCRRPADVYGPLPGGWSPTEYYCDAAQNVVNLCNDAQHIDFAAFSVPAPPAVDCFGALSTSGPANDSCVNSCLYGAGCTNGFACTGVGSIGGNRIGLCLTRGTTETGQSCTTNTQCEFGYCSGGLCSRDCTRDGICTASTTCVAAGGPSIEGFPFMRCE